MEYLCIISLYAAANCIDFGFEKKSINVNNRGVFLSAAGILKVGERLLEISVAQVAPRSNRGALPFISSIQWLF